MRIGIIARGLSEQSGGVKQYIESLTSALLRIDSENEYYIFHDSYKYVQKFPDANNIVMQSSNKVLWDFILLPITLRKYQLDVVLFPKNVIPFFINTKSIVVIHDLAYYMPELHAYPLVDTIYMKTMIKSSLKRADAIVSVSENTKNDIISLLGIDERLISVIYEAADSKYTKTTRSELEVFKRNYGLAQPYIFYSGTLSPRKNMIRFLRSFNKIKDKTLHKLVLTGGKSHNDKHVRELISKMGDSVQVLGYVPDEDMPLIYNLADLFVYPSLYEGFGLPPLEAMACGCPVIASNTSSIPEVVEDAAIIIDPYDVDEIADAMERVINDKELRKNLIEKGYENVRRFSWEKSAHEILNICKGLCKNVY